MTYNYLSMTFSLDARCPEFTCLNAHGGRGQLQFSRLLSSLHAGRLLASPTTPTRKSRPCCGRSPQQLHSEGCRLKRGVFKPFVRPSSEHNHMFVPRVCVFVNAFVSYVCPEGIASSPSPVKPSSGLEPATPLPGARSRFGIRRRSLAMTPAGPQRATMPAGLSVRALEYKPHRFVKALGGGSSKQADSL